MSKRYQMWPSRFADCEDPAKLNLMPFVEEDVTRLGKCMIRQVRT